MASLVKLKPFCKVFAKMVVIVAFMSHVGKKPCEATIFGFTSVVQIAKWLMALAWKPFFRVWQDFCRSQWRSTRKNPTNQMTPKTNVECMFRKPRQHRGVGFKIPNKSFRLRVRDEYSTRGRGRWTNRPSCSGQQRCSARSSSGRGRGRSRRSSAPTP
jgi:hypothetical protein